jgi:putative transposase
MDRLVLNDDQWQSISGLIIGRPDQKGSTGRDNRMFVEGVLWIVRTGSPWRDLPEAFGEWNSVFRRFSRWSRKGVWRRMFEAAARRLLRAGRTIRTSSISSSIPPLSALVSTPPGRKKGV